MPVARQKWPYEQVADHYAALIASGQLREGDRLPSLGDIGAAWDVSHETAHRAMELLRSRKLIVTIPREGSFVGKPREVPGAQQLLAGTRFPAAGSVTVTGIGLVPAPGYVAPILGLLEVRPGFWPVIRREQVVRQPDGRPLLLSVQWHAPELAGPVPGLLDGGPLPPGETITLIGEHTGRHVTRIVHAWETRRIRDDDREGPLLHLPPGSYISANTYTWHDSAGIIEYWEYSMIPDRVVVTETEIRAGQDDRGDR
jgi:DNA-binding GntR family transcriptional regulator